MKKLIGGLFLLNLLAISLDLSAGETDITDAGVLEQLINLREFIDEKRDFTKGAKNLKPVLIQYRSSVSKIDGIVECNLSFNTDALHLSIGGYSVQADGTPITIIINVVYEWTEYIGYTIKSAKLNATNIFNAENIENMNGYSYIPVAGTTFTDLNVLYAGACKNGNKLTLVMFMTFTYDDAEFRDVGSFKVPENVYNKLTPYLLDNVRTIDIRTLDLVKERQSIPSSAYGEIFKAGNNIITFSFAVPSGLTANTTYAVRYEATFLLSNNLVPEQAGE